VQGNTCRGVPRYNLFSPDFSPLFRTFENEKRKECNNSQGANYSMSKLKFCPRCGQELSLQNNQRTGGRERPACESCGFIDFGRYSLGVGGLVLQEQSGEPKVLLSSVTKSQTGARGLFRVALSNLMN